MRVLLSNDDGIESPALWRLALEVAESSGIEGYVVAPAEEWSAQGHAITVREPLYAERLPASGYPLPAWRVSGTPADCIKLGLHSLLPEPVDLVVAGINQGFNLATDVLYSGTVAAATEGVLGGLPAIAVSSGHESGTPTTYQFPAQVTCQLLNLLSDQMDHPWLLNVNIPATDDARVNGVWITELGPCPYIDVVRSDEDEAGRACYWLAIEPHPDRPVAGSDWEAVQKGAISLTPLEVLRLTKTNHFAGLVPVVEELQARLGEGAGPFG